MVPLVVCLVMCLPLQATSFPMTQNQFPTMNTAGGMNNAWGMNTGNTGWNTAGGMNTGNTGWNTAGAMTTGNTGWNTAGGMTTGNTGWNTAGGMNTGNTGWNAAGGLNTGTSGWAGYQNRNGGWNSNRYVQPQLNNILPWGNSQQQNNDPYSQFLLLEKGPQDYLAYRNFGVAGLTMDLPESMLAYGNMFNMNPFSRNMPGNQQNAGFQNFFNPASMVFSSLWG